MATDFLDQLAEAEVPPPPDEFDAGLRRRLNQALTASHVAGFLLRSAPYVLAHLLPAAMYLIRASVTGHWDVKNSRDAASGDAAGGSGNSKGGDSKGSD